MANFIRWNPTTHIYELSTNDAVSFVPLPLNASILTEGSIPDGRLSSNVALKNTANTFSAIQTISAPVASLDLSSTTTTNASYISFTNAGGKSYFGLERSDGGNFGALAYNTVIYAPAGRGIDFFTNTANRIRIESSGRLNVFGTALFNQTLTAPSARMRVIQGDTGAGADDVLYLAYGQTNGVIIGSGSPATPLVVYGPTTITGQLKLANDVWHAGNTDGYARFYWGASGPTYAQATQYFFWNLAGTPRVEFDTSGSIRCAGYLYPTDVNNPGVMQSSYYLSSNAGIGGLYTNASMYIAGSCSVVGPFATAGRGNFTGDAVLIGYTASIPGSAKLSVGASGATNNLLVLYNLNASNAGNLALFLNSAGNVSGAIQQTAVTTVAYLTTSDKRLKIDLGIATDVTALASIVVHDFKWKSDNTIDRGVFAQDAYPIFPRAISVGSDETDQPTKFWGTDYSKFVPDLIVGWQQHDKRISRLEGLLKERN